MFERFTTAARDVVIGAQEETRRLGHRAIGTEHLLLALLRQPDGARALLTEAGLTFERAERALIALHRETPGSLGEADAAALRSIGIDLDEVRARLAENFGPVPLAPPPRPRRGWLHRLRGEWGQAALPFSPRARKVLGLSLREAIALKHRQIGTEHLLLGLLRDGGGLGAQLLADAGIDPAELRRRTVAALRTAA